VSDHESRLHDRERMRFVACSLRERAERCERTISAAWARALEAPGGDGHAVKVEREIILEAVEFEIAAALGVSLVNLRAEVP
jgi:hypothetical protein